MNPTPQPDAARPGSPTIPEGTPLPESSTVRAYEAAGPIRKVIGLLWIATLVTVVVVAIMT